MYDDQRNDEIGQVVGKQVRADYNSYENSERNRGWRNAMLSKVNAETSNPGCEYGPCPKCVYAEPGKNARRIEHYRMRDATKSPASCERSGDFNNAYKTIYAD